MNTTIVDASSMSEELQETVTRLANADPNMLWESFKAFAPKLLTCALVLIIGLILVRAVLSFTRKLLSRSKLDPTLHHFLVSILGVTLHIILGTVVVAVLIPNAVASLVTLLGVFGLAISLAVKDSLANLAGGLSVLFTKPFSIDDYVQVNSIEGTIDEIRLNYTVMRTIDNKVIHIPNGDVAKAQIINFTGRPMRRLDLNFSIGYGDDFEQAKRIIHDILRDSPMALEEPAPLVRMVEHGDSAIKIGCRVWVKTPDYWSLKFDLLEEVKRRFDNAGISIPYNQMDVHLHQLK